MRPSRSLTMESISPEDLPRQGDSPVLLSHLLLFDFCFDASLSVVIVSVEFLEAVRQQVQKFEVQYIGNLPVSRAMGKSETGQNIS